MKKMIIPKEKLSEIEKAAKPLADFLKENCNPYCIFIVTSERIDLVEGIAGIPFEKE